MPPRLNADEAIRRARAAGVEPLAAFRGGARPWRCWCLTCGGVVYPRLTNLKGQGGCKYCAQDKRVESRKKWEKTPEGQAARKRLADARRLPAEEWMQAAERQQIRWHRTPTKGRERVPAECLQCGYGASGEWAIFPENVKAGHSCPQCAGNLRISADVHVRLAVAKNVQWHTPPKGAKAPHPATCLTCGLGSGGQWTPIPTTLYKSKIGCPRCAAQERGAAFGLTAGDHQQRAAAVGVRWRAIPPNTGTPTEAECEKCGWGNDGSWLPYPDAIYAGHACPNCAGVRALIPAEHDERAAANGVRWLETPKNISTRTPAECLTCGHGKNGEWTPFPTAVYRGSVCSNCRNLQMAAERSMPKSEHDARALGHGIRWLETPRNVNERTGAVCLKCGFGEREVWAPWPTNIYGGVQGCPGCAEFGYAAMKPAHLYVVTGRGIAKFGITGEGSAERQRLAKHRTSGLTHLAARWDFALGYLAREAEDAIKAKFAESLPPEAHVSKASLPDGFKEAVYLETFPSGICDATAAIQEIIIATDTGGVLSITDCPQCGVPCRALTRR